MKPASLPLLALILAAPAWAECPTPAAMEQGVVVTFADGMSDTFTRQGDGWVEVASGARRTSLIQGLYFSDSSVSVRPASATTEGAAVPVMPPADAGSHKTYDDPTSALPRPEAGVRITLTSTAAYMPVVAAAEDVFVTGPLGTATIGDCALAAFTVEQTETLRRPDGTVTGVTRRQMVYLADLGFAISTSGVRQDGSEWTREPVAIEVAP